MTVPQNDGNYYKLNRCSVQIYNRLHSFAGNNNKMTTQTF